MNIRFQNYKNRRYYQLYLSQDLLGDWVLTKSWGAIGTSSGKVTHIRLENYEKALRQIDVLVKSRKRLGYEHTF